ncbi:hypothetical protein M8828_01195 [Aeromonas simiae]|uniref:hypothetical protein n=1 Tax=Aeromonas simiae TaxID=218936 RepID=UPI00266C864A|nr:hypothetical protein [Aeromonas simiae]MDO2946968.1 hypothetical protein [Aeromonas simiae]MDO2954438.1 hypothetical protein [Aeromonas simiae]
MTKDSTLLAMMESKEAEANAKAEWIAEWVSNSRPLLLAGLLDTDAATLLAEVDADQACQLNQAIWLLMKDGEQVPLMQLMENLMGTALADLANDAWSNYTAELQDTMSDEQFERYQHRSAA